MQTRQRIENHGAFDTTGSLSMKIRRTEFLVAVAIISSATAIQIREYMQPHPPAAADEQSAPQLATLCGMSRNGVIPAACETMRGSEHEQKNEPARTGRTPDTPRATSQVWV
jgi:hypothetical protein